MTRCIYLPANCAPSPSIGGGIIGGANGAAGLVGRGTGLVIVKAPLNELVVDKPPTSPVFAGKQIIIIYTSAH